MTLTADVSETISGPALVAALHAMIDGADPNFLLRRTDTGPTTVNVTAEVTVEFDLAPE